MRGGRKTCQCERARRQRQLARQHRLPIRTGNFKMIAAEVRRAAEVRAGAGGRDAALVSWPRRAVTVRHSRLQGKFPAAAPPLSCCPLPRLGWM